MLRSFSNCLDDKFAKREKCVTIIIQSDYKCFLRCCQLCTYSGEHGISHTNLYAIKKKLSSLSFIVIIINHDIICDHD
jgi:hypothetical protein